MKTRANDPAFIGHTDYDGTYRAGLTKREYFAALALQGLLAGSNAQNLLDGTVGSDDIAQAAVEISSELVSALNLEALQ